MNCTWIWDNYTDANFLSNKREQQAEDKGQQNAAHIITVFVHASVYWEMWCQSYKSVSEYRNQVSLLHDFIYHYIAYNMKNSNLYNIMPVKTSNLHFTGPLWGESTGYQWIPLTKGQ